VKISREEERALSAVRHVDRIRAPITLVYGDKETPEFQRQAIHFFDVLKKASKSAELIRIDGFNHFEVMDVFADPTSQTARVALKRMGLGEERRFMADGELERKTRETDR
jgi:arylformamidase